MWRRGRKIATAINKLPCARTRVFLCALQAEACLQTDYWQIETKNLFLLLLSPPSLAACLGPVSAPALGHINALPRTFSSWTGSRKHTDNLAHFQNFLLGLPLTPFSTLSPGRTLRFLLLCGNGKQRHCVVADRGLIINEQRRLNPGHTTW